MRPECIQAVSQALGRHIIMAITAKYLSKTKQVFLKKT